MDIERLQQLGAEWEKGLASSTPPINHIQNQVKQQRRKRIAGRSAVAVVPMLLAAGVFAVVGNNSTDSIEAAEPDQEAAATTSDALVPPEPGPPDSLLPAPPAECLVADPDGQALFTDHIRYLPLDGSADITSEIVGEQLVVNAKVNENEVTLKWPATETGPTAEQGAYIFADEFESNGIIYVVPPGDGFSYADASEVVAALEGEIETPPPAADSEVLRPHLVIDNASLVPALEELGESCGSVEITTVQNGQETGPLTHQIGDTLFDTPSEGSDRDTGPLVVGTVESDAIPTEVLSCTDPSYDRIEQDIEPDYFPEPQLALGVFVEPLFGEDTPWGTSGYTEMQASDDLYAYVIPLEGSVPAAQYVRVITVERAPAGWTVTSAKATGC